MSAKQVRIVSKLWTDIWIVAKSIVGVWAAGSVRLIAQGFVPQSAQRRLARQAHHRADFSFGRRTSAEELWGDGFVGVLGCSVGYR